MQIHQDWQWLDAQARGASCALGNFDGVHLGHRSVIDLARGFTLESGETAPLGVVTFEPHPREFFQPDAPPFRLMNAEARANRLAKLGVEHLYQLPFNAALAALPPEEFVAKVLAEGLGLRHVVVGADFCFGKGRKGTAEDLKSIGARHGITTTIAPLLAQTGTAISSTAIRQALRDGRPGEAAKMLGHWHRIDGEVIHGEKRGRELGFPTANMALSRLHLPKFGVYAALVDVLTGPQAGSYLGAASLGVRPMFDGEVPNLETYLMDFKGDLYGQHLSIALVEYLRPELKFTGLPALITQMQADIDEARRILAKA